MNKIILSALFSITFSICSSQTLDSRLIEKLKRDVIYLSSDELKGRNTGTESEKIAADYIIEKLKFYNVTPKGSKGFFQEFTAKINANPHTNIGAKEITGRNVVGYLDNQS
ncbi:MAG: peptidase M28, partial [Flavobacteriales bacterium TMED84]